MMVNPGNNYDIHIECEECEGFGKLENNIGGIDNNGPWQENVEEHCYKCDGEGLVYIGRENFEDVSELKSEYPHSFAKNMETGEWV